MSLKEKIKSYSFWVSLASAVILILKVLGSRFGFTVDETMISDLFTALCSILVILGIIVIPGTKQGPITDIFKDNITQEMPTNPEGILDSVTQSTQEETQNKASDEAVEESTFKTDEIVLIPQEVISEEINNQEQSTETNFTNNEVAEEVTQTVSTNPEQNNFDSSIAFKSFLENEKSRFEGNIDEFVSILQNEINSVKNNGEAN